MKKPVLLLWEKINNELFLRGLLIFLLVVSAVLFLIVVCTDYPIWTKRYLGLTEKNEVLKFLGIGMGGLLIALQALMSYKRAKALEETANAQADAAQAQADATKEQAKANEKTEQGQRQERLKNAIEHLGHASDSVRLGGAYELFHLAEDTKDLRQTVLDILCAHIRRTTGEDEYQKKYKSKPSEEIQSLLTLLFVQEHEVFKGLHINLQGSWLNGADLARARLEGAVLTRVRLRSANLEDARLPGANLRNASLHRANLRDASLQGANLRGVSLHGANLWGAFLDGANLWGAFLDGANLWRTSLPGAFLWEASLLGADLFETSLQGANLQDASLQGAGLRDVSLQGANLLRASLHGVSSQYPLGDKSFVRLIRMRIDQETDLSGVIFDGGLSQEKIDSLVEGLSDEQAKQLREQLEPHIDQPMSHELPKNSGAITEPPYTKEEAEQWIAEYNEAMAEVLKADDN